MLACAEMITMCLQSAKKKHLLAQQQQQHQQPLHTAGQGLTIFYDVSVVFKLVFELALSSYKMCVRARVCEKQGGGWVKLQTDLLWVKLSFHSWRGLVSAGVSLLQPP